MEKETKIERKRMERERERGTRYTRKFLLFDDWCVPEDISRSTGGPMFYGAAEFTGGRFTRNVSGSGELLCRGFYVSLGIEVS